MEFLKDIYEAWGARIKSNLFGSIILAFLVVNWKPIYFVLFADATALQKFAYVDTFANDNLWKFYALPVAIGTVLALGLPRLNDLVHLAISAPINNMRKRDDKKASERLEARNARSLLGTQAHEQREKALIAQAERDEEAEEKIKDPARLKRLQTEIEESRADKETGPEKVSYVLQSSMAEAIGKLSKLDFASLKSFAANKAGVFRLVESNGKYSILFMSGESSLIGDRRSFLATEKGCERLVAAGLLLQNQEWLKITDAGYDHLEKFKK